MTRYSLAIVRDAIVGFTAVLTVLILLLIAASGVPV